MAFLALCLGIGWNWRQRPLVSENRASGSLATPSGHEKPAPTPVVAASQPAATASRAGTAEAGLLETLLDSGEVGLPMPGGRRQGFRLALNELYEPRKGVRAVPPQADARALVSHAEAQAAATGVWPGLVLYPAGQKEPRKEAVHVLTGRLLVTLKDAAGPEPAFREAGLELVERPAYSPVHRVVQSQGGSPLEALRGLQKLARQSPLVAAVTPLLKTRVAAKSVVPNDPLFSWQWHLLNTGPRGAVAGFDCQVLPAWEQGQGQGVIVGVVDDGVQFSHPDLAPNIHPGALHMNFLAPVFSAEPDPDSTDAHGTAVAGVIAARSNNGIGGAGVAPRASLVSLLLVVDELADDAENAASVAHRNDVIAVKNNSWGAPDGNGESFLPGPLFLAAMENAATAGRGGLGVLSVWASGNGRTALDQGNKDGYANSIYGISVGALGPDGRLAYYSEGGAHLTCVAPSGIRALGLTTTDLQGEGGFNPQTGIRDIDTDNYSYTATLMGTSFSAPVVSGVCALMLEANPQLSWRDVKEILLRTSREIEPGSSSWVRRVGNRPGVEVQGMPRIKHHPSYGGGLVQAQAAVELARRWVPLGPQTTVEHIYTAPTEEEGTGGTGTGQANAGLRWSIPGPYTPPSSKPVAAGRRIVRPIDMSGQAIRVENVELTLELTGVERKDLSVVLRSPAGTASQLFTAAATDEGAVTEEMSYSSMRHWGEPGQGVWQLEITDHRQPQQEFTVVSERLRLTGTTVPAPSVGTQSVSQVVYEGQPVSLTASVITPTGITATRQWWKDGARLRGQTGDVLSGIGLRLADAGVYEHTADHEWGRATTGRMSIGVMKAAIPDVTVVEGRTAMLTCTATGPGVGYQWYHSGTGHPVVETARVTGTRSPRLVIRQAGPDDEHTYHCVVTVALNGLPTAGRPSQPGRLYLLRLPVVDAAALQNTALVGRELDLRLLADSGVTRWKVSGLPAGVRFDPATGRLSGQARVPGFHVIIITASNAVGTSPPLRVIWEVKGPPSGVAGTFHGLLARNERYNGGLGGSLTLTVANSAIFTGKLTRGLHQHAFQGTLVGSTDEGVPWQGIVSLPRRSPYGPLTLRFSIDPAQARLAGTLGDESLSVPDLADVAALRAAFSQREPAGPLAGRWHVAYEPPPGLAGDVRVPQGAAWAVQTVSAAGAAQWAARLADGTAITAAGGLALDGSLPVHVMLYGNMGSVQGWQRINSTTAAYSGSLGWLKLPVYSGTSYAVAFSLHELTGAGARWVPPGYYQRLFDIPLASANSRLVFQRGGLAVPFQQLLTLALGNVLQISSDAAANPHALSVSLNATTGIIQGSGRAMDIDPLNPGLKRQRPGTFSALCIPGRLQAVGHFLLPSSTQRGASVLSGSLVWEAAPAP